MLRKVAKGNEVWGGSEYAYLFAWERRERRLILRN
jgi:hypothetical protein